MTPTLATFDLRWWSSQTRTLGQVHGAFQPLLFLYFVELRNHTLDTDHNIMSLDTHIVKVVYKGEQKNLHLWMGGNGRINKD